MKSSRKYSLLAAKTDLWALYSSPSISRVTSQNWLESLCWFSWFKTDRQCLEDDCFTRPLLSTCHKQHYENFITFRLCLCKHSHWNTEKDYLLQPSKQFKPVPSYYYSLFPPTPLPQNCQLLPSPKKVWADNWKNWKTYPNSFLDCIFQCYNVKQFLDSSLYMSMSPQLPSSRVRGNFIFWRLYIIIDFM